MFKITEYIIQYKPELDFLSAAPGHKNPCLPAPFSFYAVVILLSLKIKFNMLAHALFFVKLCA